VKYALGALAVINKCVAAQLKAGTAGNLAAVCVGGFSGGSFVQPSDPKVGPKLQTLIDKAEASVDKACTPLTSFAIKSLPICGGVTSVADIKNCLVCEGWDSTLDIVKAQYSETGTFVANGANAIQNAVDASGPGAKLLVQSG